jgi:hypothetical protein
MNRKAAWLLEVRAVSYSDYTSVMNRKFTKKNSKTGRDCLKRHGSGRRNGSDFRVLKNFRGECRLKVFLKD